MKNKKSQFIMLVLLIIILLIILSLNRIWDNQDNNICKNKCKDAMEYETKSHGSLIDWIFGDYKLNCICYYEDGIKTKKGRN